MIKGCSKKIIVVKDTGSDFFDEAYFIIKPQHNMGKIKSENDFVKEANRVISQSVIKGFEKNTKQYNTKGKRDIIMFAGGFLACTLICFALYFATI